MVHFGRFEIVRELHRTGLAVVYSAQETGDSQEKFAIKVFEPPSFAMEEDTAKIESNRFLDSARIQQKVASGGTEHWAPVYECGATDNGGFYASDRYDRSLQQLIDGRIRLSSRLLLALIEPIAKGLRELKDQCERPHGNLKATNVLIGGEGDIAQTKVVLSDPSSIGQIEAETYWNKDLRAIAGFIYELVTHRPMPAVKGWKVPESKEWAKLGRHAKAWRNLCNLLLTGPAESAAITIDTVIEHLEKLRKASSALSTRRMIYAGIGLIACTILIIVIVRRPPPPPEKAEWESLCNTYQDWVDDLRKSLAKRDIEDRWEGDPHLKGIREKVKIASYPYKVVRDEAKSNILEIIDHPKYAEQRKTQDALAAIEQIKSFFDPNSSHAWPLLARVVQTSNQFNVHGWKESATYLNNLIEGAKPGREKPIADSVGMILEITKDMNDIDWEAFNNEQEKDSVENPREPTFTYRPETIRDYYILRPDPRKVIFDLVSDVNQCIEIARICNPGEANKCREDLNGLRQDINDLREFPLIAKYNEDILEKKEECQPRLDELLGNACEALLTAFGIIEGDLKLCYLLDDPIPQADQPIRFVWKNWNDASILKENSRVCEKYPNVRTAVKKLRASIKKLEKIEESSEPQQLVRDALEPNIETEMVYVTWTRLEELPWPERYEDLKQDRMIRDRLKKDFVIMRDKNETRAKRFIAELADTGIEYETVFINKNRSGDESLGRLVQYAVDVNCINLPSDCNIIEHSARAIADFLASEDWQDGKIRTDLFAEESNFYEPQITITAETFAQWLTEARGYKKLEEDPRQLREDSWDEKLRKIKMEIDKEIARTEEGDYRTTLLELSNDFNDVKIDINEMRKLQAIEKNKSGIEKCSDYWEELSGIERKLKPEYCGRLDIDNGRLVFSTNQLNPNFEPINVEKKSSIPMPEGWTQVRSAVENRQPEWLDFFYTIDGNDVINVGWPRYIRSIQDPTVILTFIPAGASNNEPFYMAINEITNAQYRLFLEKTGARSRYSTRSWFVNRSNQYLIQSDPKYKPCGIKWDRSKKTFVVAQADINIPVGYVTYFGAQSYAEWFGGKLPNASQHLYAWKAGTNSLYPWANDQEIANYAHVRAGNWLIARDAYNSKLGSVTGTIEPPVGAVRPEGFIPYDKDPSRSRLTDSEDEVVHNNSTTYHSAWPVASATNPNDWDLYDMIGNVWEWCHDNSQPVICGGSCLAPPEYILNLESNYTLNYDDKACDVGFRIIVPAR